MERHRIDIIYVNYNSTDYLLASIESVQRHIPAHIDAGIWVVENASANDAQRIEAGYPDVHVVYNSRNVGFGAAVNQVLKACRSDYIILLNPDSMAVNGFISTAIDYMQRHPRTGIVGPMILDEGYGIQGSARSFPTPLTSFFGRNSPITRLYPNNSITRANILTIDSDEISPMAVDWVSGACMVARREAICQVGGFDERFFLYWEDTDLCRRTKDAGWDIVYLPRARVIHLGAKSSNTRPLFANFHFHKSCYRLYDKYARWPYSIFTPVAGMALMLRFLLAAAINYLHSLGKRLPVPEALGGSQAMPHAGKIRVMRIISRLNIGGPSIHVKNLTENIDPERFTTRLVTGSISPGEGDMSYIADFGKDVRLPLPELQREISPWHDLVALFKVVREIHRFKPDIVHSHTSKAGTVARLAALVTLAMKIRRPFMVHTFHGHVLDGYFSRSKSILILLLERALGLFTDSIIAISATQKTELSKKYKISPARCIETIGLGFNLAPFVDNARYNGVLRRKLHVGSETRLIGVVGRMVAIKNHIMFLDAAKRLLDGQPSLKVRFVLVGGGELRAELEKHATLIGIQDYVVFYGWEKNIPMIYADLDILALTSLNEGTPVSIIEAMAASVPVITTGVGGIKDLLGRIDTDQPGGRHFHICERGILCPTDDPIAFSNALRHMIDSDYLLDKQKLLKARSFVIENFSVRRLVHDIDALYEKLMRGKDSHGI